MVKFIADFELQLTKFIHVLTCVS